MALHELPEEVEDPPLSRCQEGAHVCILLYIHDHVKGLWFVGRGHTFTGWGLPRVCPLKAPAPRRDLLLPYPSPGVFDEVIHLFLGTGLSQGNAEPEIYEEIATVRMPIGEALRLAASGEIRDGKTIAALLRAGNLGRGHTFT